ncbi:MAG: cytochrome c biogenesis protein ResB [Desulfobaccales bacterium]
MSTTKSPARPKYWLWGWLTSIRLTVFLLLILAAVAILGTVLPQKQPAEAYFASFGELWGTIIWRSGLGDIYFSILPPWFLGPVCLLALNILSCLINGLPRAWRRAFTLLTVEAALTLPPRGSLKWPRGTDPRGAAARIWRRELGRTRRQVLPGKEVFSHESGRFRPLGPYLVHLALLLILAGGLIGKFWGIDGSLPLMQGTTAQSFLVGPSDREMPLGFQVRLDRFQVEYYEEGSIPKEFRSDLTFTKNGQNPPGGAELRATCRVNEPVSFGGFTFYQASYGTQPEGPVRLQVIQGSRRESLHLSLHQFVTLPGGEAQIMLIKLEGNLEGYGPAVQLAYKSGQEHPAVFWVLKDHPEMQEPIGPYRFALEEANFQYYSVFQVKQDPGVPWVYLGFLLLLPGFYLAFFRPHQVWALVLEKSPQGDWQGRLLGSSPRNREDFDLRQTRLLEELKKGTPS